MTESSNPKGKFLLVWLDSTRSIDPPALMPIRRAIEDKVTRPREETEIDVWLESPGGDAHTAFKLALMLRQAATTVRIVIPDYAKSAATLLALAGDEIYMGPGAELGPLDAQIPEEGSLAGRISALNIARAADDVARNAINIALAGGAEVIQVTGLSRAETMSVMFEFSARFSEPLVRQLDPRVVHDAKQLLEVTVEYASRLLAMTNCTDAERTAHRMVEDYPTHGFVIDIDEARSIGLPAQPLAGYEHFPDVQALHRIAEEGAGMIEFGPIEDYLPDPRNAGGEEEHGDEQEADEKHRSDDGGPPPPDETAIPSHSATV